MSKIQEQAELAAVACLARLDMSEGDRGYYVKLLAEPIAAGIIACLPRWIPIGERPPDKARDVLIKHGSLGSELVDSQMSVGWLDGDENWYANVGPDYPELVGVTHWQELDRF